MLNRCSLGRELEVTLRHILAFIVKGSKRRLTSDLLMVGVSLIIQAGVKVSSVHKRPVPDKKENAVKKAVVAPVRNEVLVKEATCESSTPSWASDHNYNAVKPEQTAALWPSLLCKCMYHLGVASGPFPVFLDGCPLGTVQS